MGRYKPRHEIQYHHKIKHMMVTEAFESDRDEPLEWDEISGCVCDHFSFEMSCCSQEFADWLTERFEENTSVFPELLSSPRREHTIYMVHKFEKIN
jgi:hypothetical protein